MDDSIAATLNNHKGSMQEPGKLRFDVLQQRDDPACFTLYEAYESDEAAAKHKEKPHFDPINRIVRTVLSAERCWRK